MFLTRLAAKVRRDDRGAALASVMGLMFVGLLISTLIASAVVSSVAYTTVTRAGVQSQASADAGVAAARAGLAAGTCAARGGVYSSAAGAVPEYRATVWIPNGSGWIQGCPANTSTQVRILAEGNAQAEGVAGASAGDTALVEVILSSAAGGGGGDGVGPALYAYTMSGLGGSGRIVASDGTTPTVLVRTGNVVCDGGGTGTPRQADFVVEEGGLTVSGGCRITGNAWARDAVVMSGTGTVTGNVVGSSLSMASAVIGGSAWIRGNSAISNAGDNRISGNLTTRTRSGNGVLSTIVRGTTTITNPADPGPSPFEKPTVPNWVDVTFDSADWPGHTIVTMSADCSETRILAALTTIGTNPGVIDARGCTGGVFNTGGWRNYPLSNDLAIIATEFVLGGSSNFSATRPVKLWFITPDTSPASAPNQRPDCPTVTEPRNGNRPPIVRDARFTIDGTFGVPSPITTMIYTPCSLTLGSSNRVWGQIYAGTSQINGNATLTYVPVGLPGVDLEPGSQTGGGGEADRSVLSRRTVAEQ